MSGLIPSARWILNRIRGVDGSGSDLDADKLDGLDATAFALAGHTHPGAPGGVYLHLTPEMSVLGASAAPLLRVTEGANLVWQELVYADGVYQAAFFNFPLPTAFGGGANTVVKLYWKATANGTVRWAVSHRSNPGASWDGVMSAEVTQDVVAPVSVGDLKVTTFTLPGWPDGPEMVNLKVIRRGVDGADTLVGDALLLGVEIEES